MAARDYVTSVFNEAQREHNQFRSQASTWDYIQETLKMFVAGAIMMRVLTQCLVYVQDHRGIEADDINWVFFGPALATNSPRADMAGRTLQSIIMFNAILGAGPTFEAGLGVSAIVALQAVALVVDPLLGLMDYH